MKTEKKIPFDLKRWQKGDFLRIENYRGEEVEQIFYFDKLKDEKYPIRAVIGGEMWSFTEKGIFNLNLLGKKDLNPNLYLIIEVEEEKGSFANIYVKKYGNLESFTVGTTHETLSLAKQYISKSPLSGEYVKTINIKDFI